MLQEADIVRQIVWQDLGQITKEFNNFWDITEDYLKNPIEWLELQTVPFNSDEVNNQRWFSVHCFDGGSILSCENKLELIDRISL